MERTKTTTTLALAATCAALFALGAPTTVQAADDMGVQCVGANSCKGHSECKTAKNDCKGMNSCKGQGWTQTKSAEECTKAGGKPAMAK